MTLEGRILVHWHLSLTAPDSPDEMANVSLDRTRRQNKTNIDDRVCDTEESRRHAPSASRRWDASNSRRLILLRSSPGAYAGHHVKS